MSKTIQHKQPLLSSCMHNLKDQITIEHEVICKSCGMVLGLDNSQEVKSEPNINLFQEIQPGCNPVKFAFHGKYHEQKFLSSTFSNTCSKLDLPRHVSITAWNIFIKLTKKQKIQQSNFGYNKTSHSTFMTNSIFFSYGAIAMFSIFLSCREFSIPKSEIEISNAVKLTFSIKQIPTLLRLFSILKPLLNELGMDLDDDHFEYYLNIYLRKFSKQNMMLPNDIKQRARLIANSLFGNDETKARNSVKIVLAGLGINNV